MGQNYEVSAENDLSIVLSGILKKNGMSLSEFIDSSGTLHMDVVLEKFKEFGIINNDTYLEIQRCLNK